MTKGHQNEGTTKMTITPENAVPGTDVRMTYTNGRTIEGRTISTVYVKPAMGVDRPWIDVMVDEDGDDIRPVYFEDGQWVDLGTGSFEMN